MSLASNLTSLVGRIGTEIKTLRAERIAVTGNLIDLTTTQKSTLVAAINEAAAGGGDTGPVTAADITDATSTGRALLTAPGPADARTTLDTYSKAEADASAAAAASALVGSAPAALDTLAELAAALGGDASYAATTAAALGNRLRVDAAQGLSGPQKQFGRDNLDTYSKAEIGDPETDFVAAFEAALA